MYTKEPKATKTVTMRLYREVAVPSCAMLTVLIYHCKTHF